MNITCIAPVDATSDNLQVPLDDDDYPNKSIAELVLRTSILTNSHH